MHLTSCPVKGVAECCRVKPLHQIKILPDGIGFVSLDCGGKDNFTDKLGLAWTPDTQMVSGDIAKISVANETRTQYMALRYFPADNRKYCYTLDVIPRNRQPFISTLELRHFNGSRYMTEYENEFFMSVSARINFGAESDDPVRYPDDPFDRIWESDTTGNYLVDVAVGTEEFQPKCQLM
ncbi:hypothetical protein HAX54_026853 [Datura stramonium]|uniref:Malectin-like domain-containing protein n=1 Tax=Datura stramonium TaxID=4076 RepID=A0ABS8V1N5_DATST|nr:hypothetical protein [Datura stramonium]